MARRAHAYPQVMPAAADLIDGTVAAAPAGITAGDALRLAERRHVAVIVCGGAHVLREDLARAHGLGLGELEAADLARPLPVLEPRTPELVVRRRLAAGAAAIVVADRRGVLGVVARRGMAPSRSLAASLRARCDAATRTRLEQAATAAARVGARAYLAGGVVRDVLRGEVVTRDVDVVVEGDGPAVARALASALRGGLVEHERFLTASVTVPDGSRIDVVTARSERYERPGALPRVLPASIQQDLRRRDFSVNAMAVALDDGELLDPLGGAVDVERRRLRALHPLSFVEDPTRMFRLARYGARLAFAVEPWTRRWQALAVRLVPYPALSGQRLGVEIEKIAGDAAPDAALARLGRAGALRLPHGRYRYGAATAALLSALPEALLWTARRQLAVSPRDVTVLAVLGEQPLDVARGWLAGIAVQGEPLARLLSALDGARGLAARVKAAATPSAAAAAVRRATPLHVAAAYLRGDAETRGRLDRHAVGAPDDGLRGDDVIALGVPRGPAIAQVLAELRDRRLDGEIADRAGEIDYVESWVAARRRPEREG